MQDDTKRALNDGAHAPASICTAQDEAVQKSAKETDQDGKVSFVAAGATSISTALDEIERSELLPALKLLRLCPEHRAAECQDVHATMQFLTLHTRHETGRKSVERHSVDEANMPQQHTLATLRDNNEHMHSTSSREFTDCSVDARSLNTEKDTDFTSGWFSQSCQMYTVKNPCGDESFCRPAAAESSSEQSFIPLPQVTLDFHGSNSYPQGHGNKCMHESYIDHATKLGSLLVSMTTNDICPSPA